MAKEDGEKISGLVENAINTLEKLNLSHYRNDEEVKSWLSIYKELLGNYKIGPREDSENLVWLHHLKAIKPYLLVYGLERGIEESRLRRERGR